MRQPDDPGVDDDPGVALPGDDDAGGFVVVVFVCMIIGLVFVLLIWLFASSAISQTDPHSHRGHMGQGHDTWHGPFYQRLMRPDTKTSCCNLYDCRPTQSRTMGANYQVLLDGEWIDVPPRVIVRVSAPDGGAHVCAPEQKGANKGVLYCVVLPSEG